MKIGALGKRLIDWSPGSAGNGAAQLRFEYSIIAAGVALVVATAITMLGKNVLDNLYSQLAGLF